METVIAEGKNPRLTPDYCHQICRRTLMGNPRTIEELRYCRGFCDFEGLVPSKLYRDIYASNRTDWHHWPQLCNTHSGTRGHHYISPSAVKFRSKICSSGGSCQLLQFLAGGTACKGLRAMA